MRQPRLLQRSDPIEPRATNGESAAFSVGLGERPALVTRFRRACPGSERTSDSYIERPIIPPFPRESPKAIPAEMGASWQRRFGSCQLYPRPGQAQRKIFQSNRGVYRIIKLYTLLFPVGKTTDSYY